MKIQERRGNRDLRGNDLLGNYANTNNFRWNYSPQNTRMNDRRVQNDYSKPKMGPQGKTGPEQAGINQISSYWDVDDHPAQGEDDNLDDPIGSHWATQSAGQQNIDEINYVQFNSNNNQYTPTHGYNRRRNTIPIATEQFDLLEKLRNTVGPAKTLQEAAPNLDSRLLPLLAGVANGQCLNCGLYNHRMGSPACPLDGKPLRANRCPRCLVGLHSGLDCINTAIANCQADKVANSSNVETSNSNSNPKN